MSLWSCELCDMTMPRKYKGSHVNGTPHSHKLALSRVLSPAAEASGTEKPKWKCLICNCTMKTQYKRTHLASKPHNTKLEAFNHDNAIEMPPARGKSNTGNTSYTGPPHPNGKRFIKICEVRDVYDDLDDMPTEAWEKAQIKISHGRNTFVTAAQVKEARDIYESWDNEGGDSQSESTKNTPRGVPVDLDSGWN